MTRGLSLDELKQAYGVFTPPELMKLSQQMPASYLVEGLIPTRSVDIVVGDSGIGKTPLMYQLAMCVAAGITFLGHKVQQGRVLYLDYENGIEDMALLSHAWRSISNSQSRRRRNYCYGVGL